MDPEMRKELQAIEFAAALFEQQCQEQARQRAELDNSRAEELARRELARSLLHIACTQAEEARQQKFPEASLRRLAESFVKASRQLLVIDGPMSLDRLPVSEEAHPELLPLRFAIQVLKTA
jgi:hypothetical protein